MIVCTLCAGLAVIIAFFYEESSALFTKATVTTSLLLREKVPSVSSLSGASFGEAELDRLAL